MIQSEKGLVAEDRDACLTDIEQSVIGDPALGRVEAAGTSVLRG